MFSKAETEINHNPKFDEEATELYYFYASTRLKFILVQKTMLKSG